MFIYARSEQRDLVPICTITNTQRIGICQGKLTAPGQRKPKLYSRFLLLRIHPDSPVHTSAIKESIQICSVMGKCI